MVLQKNFEKAGKNQSTISAYKRALKNFKNFLANYNAIEINYEIIKNWFLNYQNKHYESVKDTMSKEEQDAMTQIFQAGTKAQNEFKSFVNTVYKKSTLPKNDNQNLKFHPGPLWMNQGQNTLPYL